MARRCGKQKSFLLLPGIEAQILVRQAPSLAPAPTKPIQFTFRNRKCKYTTDKIIRMKEITGMTIHKPEA
jgi:hypothetical protein